MYDSALAIGDINGDGNIDLVSVGKTSGIARGAAVYEGEGNGRFRNTNEGIITPVDRGDGKLDLLIIGLDRSHKRKTRIYKNNN